MGFLRFLFFLVAGLIFYSILRKVLRKMGGGSGTKQGGSGKAGNTLVEDPLCGLYVSRERAVRRSVEGKETFFCSDACADKYLVSMGDKRS